MNKKHYFRYKNSELDYLKNSDPVLRQAIERVGRVEREIIPDIFKALVYMVIGQLISAQVASSIWNKMLCKFEDITPQNISQKSAEDIQSCGLTMRKACCIKQIADMVNNSELNLDELYELSDEEVVKKLCGIKGIGKWTAQMILIHAMERKDVISWEDVAIKRGMCKLYGLESISKESFDEYKNRYSPYASIASIYLWHLSIKDIK